MGLTPKQKRIVNVAWKQIEEFIKDWQGSPFEWNTERDIQAEVAARIKSALKNCDIHTYEADYTYKKPEGLEGRQPYNRVCCEPPLHIGKKRNWCKPDIVIFDDLKNPDAPPDVNVKGGKPTGRNCPVIWVCEIKYQPEWSSKDPDKKENRDWHKIRQLRKQKDTQYACWLNISRKRAQSGNGFPKPPKTRRFKKYNIKLPTSY